MRGFCFFVLFIGLVAQAFASESKRSFDTFFQDQEQYETYFDYKYQNNKVEFFIFECTGKRNIAWKFGLINADIGNSLQRILLDVPDFESPFSELPVYKNLYIETRLMTSRNPDYLGGSGDPTHDAHRDVLRIFREFKDERDVLCDFVFWEQVLTLEQAVGILLKDTRNRYKGSEELAVFETEIAESLEALDRLFAANPLK